MSTLDNLRDRWEAISPRERKLVALLGVSFVVILVIFFSLRIADRLGALERQNAKMRRALWALAELRARGHKDEAPNPAAAIGNEPVKLESYLDRIAQKVGVTIPQYNPGSPATKGAFVAHSMRIELRELTMNQVKDLLQAIETDNPLVVVTSLSLNQNFRDKQKLDIKLQIETYAHAAAASADKGS